MPYIEQLLYGHDHKQETGERRQLAHSAGMGAEVAAEICALCDSWGQVPDLGLNRPVLLGAPLMGTMPSMRGRLYTVIRVRAGTVPLFHAYVITDAAYMGFGRNPYTLAQALNFCDEWNGREGMDRVEVESEAGLQPFDPPAHADDVGLVDEAVLQFITTGSLVLPLEHSVRESERALALIIACLPEKDRKNLKFASFTTVKVNAYDVCCLQTEGAMFAGWKRLMMARIDSGVTEKQQEYKELLGKYLAAGDMAGIARTSSRHDFKIPTATKPLVATREGTPKPVPASPAAGVAAPTSPTGFGPASTVKPTSSKPLVAKPPMGPAQHRSVMPEHGLDPTINHIGKSLRRSLTKRRRVSPGRPHVGGSRGGGRFMRTVSALLLLFVAGWVGTMWLEGRTLQESLEWAGLPGMDGRAEENSRAGTLLEVVDVGHVYGRALKHVGNKGLGLNAAGDKGREKALGRLKADAAMPLLEQVTLFVGLSDDGIQQSGRQDREVERLESLAGQGAVLQKEMTRLELAWFSLTTGVNWRDLGRISDLAVEARRDSLDKAEARALIDIRANMGTTELRADLDRAQRQMDGMAGVVALFQARQWSPVWEKKLAAAAGKVSPSAGTTTRAYRNSAFALLRLKRAEREFANQELPFTVPYVPDQWPSAAVKDVLPLLRREAGRFANQSAPRILSATLALYASLENPEATIADLRRAPGLWQKLNDNAALAFDPDLYAPFLGRLRYEAAQQITRRGADPSAIPRHLFAGPSAVDAVAFADSLKSLTEVEQWQAMAANLTDPFLNQWARHMADKREARLAYLHDRFARTWSECRTGTASLQAEAKAGYDWSDPWRDLYSLATRASAEFAATLREDPDKEPQLAYLDTLARAMTRPLPLHLTRATVRLEKAGLADAQLVRLQLRTPGSGGVWTSEPFLMGPSAPEETGWVGTVFLDWRVPVSGLDALAVQVSSVDKPRVLLQVPYASLAEGEGVGALARVRSVPDGSIGFKGDWVDYWQALTVPDLGPVF